MSAPVYTILVVDDHLDTLDLIELYLYRSFNVFTAVNGFEGLKAAADTIPDLIITDIMMPVVDGIRLYNDLRKNEKTAGVPVLAMTSFVKKLTKKSLFNIGFCGVIEKPVDRQQLFLAIGGILGIPSLTEGMVSDETNV